MSFNFVGRFSRPYFESFARLSRKPGVVVVVVKSEKDVIERIIELISESDGSDDIAVMCTLRELVAVLEG